jgi:hypothetical protein
MKFLFWLANHSDAGQRSLEDPIGIFGRQLRALGHEAVWSKANDQLWPKEEGINVLVEGFTRAAVPVIEDYYRQGARFLCLATEEPTPKGFNWGRDPEMVKRQEVFPEVARFLEGIFHLVPGQHVADWYARHAPTSYVELGYAPSLVRIVRAATEPKFDFGFFGSLTRRRHTILKRLAKFVGSQHAVRIEATFADQDKRDELMREAKVIVQVRKFHEMGLVSSTRCNTALCLGRPVVGESHELSKPWDEIVRFTPQCDDCLNGKALGRDDVCDKCLQLFMSTAVIMKGMWRGVHADQFEKFKVKLTPNHCVGRAFREIGMDISGKTFRRVDPVIEGRAA